MRFMRGAIAPQMHLAKRFQMHITVVSVSFKWQQFAYPDALFLFTCQICDLEGSHLDLFRLECNGLILGVE